MDYCIKKKLYKKLIIIDSILKFSERVNIIHGLLNRKNCSCPQAIRNNSSIRPIHFPDGAFQTGCLNLTQFRLVCIARYMWLMVLAGQAAVLIRAINFLPPSMWCSVV